MVEEVEDQKSESNPASPSMMKMAVLVVVITVVLSSSMTGIMLYFMNDAYTEHQQGDASEESEDSEEVEEEESEPLKAPQYHAVDPKFVVSFRDQQQARFMQFSLEIMTREDEVINNIKLHMPAIRSNLLILCGNQQHQDVASSSGKEKFLLDIKESINQTLDKLAGQSGVEAAYFTNFIIQ